MSEGRYKVEEGHSTGLCLRGLTKTTELDCSARPHLEVVELHNSPGVTRIHFGTESPSTSRLIRIGGDWSGSIYIDSAIQSLEYISDNNLKNVSIGSSENILDPRLRIGVNALITNSLSELLSHQGQVDDFLFLADATAPSHVEIGLNDGLPFRHLGISGSSSIETLTIHCLEGGAESISLHGLPNLQSVHINGQTKLLEAVFCPSLRRVHGQGETLRCKDAWIRQIALSGIWGSVDSVRPISTRFPTVEEILTCSDISWIHIPAFSYEAQIKWTEMFNLDIGDVMEGIPIQKMLDKLELDGEKFFEDVEEWIMNLLTPTEQYIGMRLITSLCLRGLPRELIWRARDSILTMNKQYSNLSPPDVSQRFTRGANWFNITPFAQRRVANARFGLGVNCWAAGEDAHLPIDRLDVEIWIETGGVGEKSKRLLPEEIVNKYRPNEFSMFISTALDKREEGTEARDRQDGLMECLFDDLKNSYMGRDFDSIACLLTQFGIENIPEIVDLFIDALLASPVRPRAQIAIGAALLQYTDDIRLRSLMMKHRSSSEIGRVEANTLHALSLAGMRAYTDGRVPPLEWPAIENWRILHEN